jgi:serine/threonine protein kinase/tetratricopeptide (TPR) repeat protein
MPVAAGRVLAHYRLISKLGAGGNGEVWRAHDDKLDRAVALKLLPGEAAESPLLRTRFQREAKAVAALSHPNIVTIHAVEEWNGADCIVMELVEGETLQDRMRRGPLDEHELRAVGAHVAEALAAAHAIGVIHRDIKPANIMITSEGRTKVLDFGLAKIVRPGEDETPQSEMATDLTGSQCTVGTIGYMSPEQVRGGPVDHRSDIFSLGVVLYELATGVLPFDGDTAVDTLAAILRDEPEPASRRRFQLSRQLDRVLFRCLAKSPDRRPQSALDLRNELEQSRYEHPSDVLEEASGPSIAVLPFNDMSREHDQDYFCEGMAEEIINALSRIRGLRVASRTSSFGFKDAALDPRQIGRRLEVGHLLEGGVRKAGDRLRITAQLIDADSGYHTWSDRYERELADVFTLQDEIARDIAQALRVRLGPREAEEPRRKVPTRDIQAYDYYLRGRKFYHRYGRREIEFALQLFSRATERDSDYALAWAGLADCWVYLFWHAEKTDAIREQAETASRRAVELDPASSQALASRGNALSAAGDDERAREAFEAAIRLDPELFETRYFYARHLFTQGDLEGAVVQYDEAMRIRPEDYQSPLLVAQSLDDLDRPERARECRRRGVRLAEAWLELNPDDARAVYMAANGMVALGEIERGLELAARAASMTPSEPITLYNVACVESMGGEIEAALDHLDAAVEHGLTMKGWLDHDSNLDAVRGHERFVRLMRRLEELNGGAHGV